MGSIVSCLLTVLGVNVTKTATVVSSVVQGTFKAMLPSVVKLAQGWYKAWRAMSNVVQVISVLSALSVKLARQACTKELLRLV